MISEFDRGKILIVKFPFDTADGDYPSVKNWSNASCGGEATFFAV